MRCGDWWNGERGCVSENARCELPLPHANALEFLPYNLVAVMNVRDITVLMRWLLIHSGFK